MGVKLNSNIYESLGLVSGLVSIFSAFIFISIAYINTPSYDPINQTISKLGLSRQGAFPFSLGTIISGISLSFYFLFYLKPKLKHVLNNTYFGLKSINIVITAGILGAFFLIGVGYFPDKAETSLPHFISATFFFSSIGITIFLISFEYRNTTKYNIAAYGFLVTGLALLHGFFSTIDFYGAIWQKIVVTNYLVWHLINMLKLRNSN